MIRPATHAGTWYDKNPESLASKVANWIQKAQLAGSKIKPSARYAIGPHAGYRFCGPVLAHTYAQLDATIDRIILMGPSHFKYFKGIRSTAFDSFATPLGDLQVDQKLVGSLKQSCNVLPLDPDTDFREHSWEMHLPFIAKVAPQATVVPLLFGAFDKGQTADLVRELSQVLTNSNTAVVVSSDFCHWGEAFDYTPFSNAKNLIHERIKDLDYEAIDLLTSGQSSSAWHNYIKRTGNTICGATPIRVMLMLIESLGETAKFRDLAYAHSSPVTRATDSSVSYAALAA